MKRMPFEPPTDYYNKQIEMIDEQLCKLLKQRKELSNKNPGFPNKDLVSAWAEKYEFHEEFLNSLFVHLFNEDIYRPVVEPKGFIRNIPILRSFEKDGLFYSITFLGQFENASVVHFNIDKTDYDMHFEDHSFFELSIEADGAAYDCRDEGGGGSGGHMSHTFIVTPALPDNSFEYKFVFKEQKGPFQKTTGFEFVI
ncbi:hypothetical protein CWR48_10440 [Oceanobacillus arenosus]|uniref:Uncharacterized protein n=1 Tax=Oceanobacillus arenosus TaxID=1229153 RepID=A0A3D8PTW4_9BACI|nr:hypothetical protein [Oceanobacillus arenosus]RDW18731.1 hypothetical protein CWR48_10440 [Oceanobacillus arenosus]